MPLKRRDGPSTIGPIPQLGVPIAVRREKARIFSGCDSRPDNWSLHPVAIGAAAEVTKPSKPSRQRAALGGSASRQAATQVNAVQAPKQPDVEADPVAIRGRPPSLGTRGGYPSRRDTLQGSHRGIGGGMPAHGDPTQHGKPRRWGRVTPNRQPARARSGRSRWRRGPYERGTRVTPGEQRGLSSRSTPQGAGKPGDWR